MHVLRLVTPYARFSKATERLYIYRIPHHRLPDFAVSITPNPRLSPRRMSFLEAVHPTGMIQQYLPLCPAMTRSATRQ